MPRKSFISSGPTVFTVAPEKCGAGGTFLVTLLDNIEFIRTSSARERESVLRAFTSRGITRLPDGRRIESVVL